MGKGSSCTLTQDVLLPACITDIMKAISPELDASGKREHITGGGFNIVVTKEILRLPSFRIKVGKVPVELKNLAVDTTNGDFQTSDDAGIIGMDMVNQFDCVTINLKEMFLKLE